MQGATTASCKSFLNYLEERIGQRDHHFSIQMLNEKFANRYEISWSMRKDGHCVCVFLFGDLVTNSILAGTWPRV